MRKLFVGLCSAAVLVTGIGQANAAPLTINIEGTVSSISGSAVSSNNIFSVGDSFSYRVRLDDSLIAPPDENPNLHGNAQRSLSLVNEFEARIGSYQVSGNSGDVFLRNNGVTGVFPGTPYDQLSLSHNSEPIYNQSFNLPGRTDFVSTDGPVVGEAVSNLGFTFQSPDFEFVGSGQNLTGIAKTIEATPSLFGGPFATNGVRASLRFSDQGFGSVPLNVDLDVVSFNVNPVVSSAPVAFGTAAAAIVKDQRFDNTVQTFNTSSENPSDPDSHSLAFSTSAGLAQARGEIKPSGFGNSTTGAPGLEVGAFANGAGGAGNTASRGIAFRSYEYTGSDSVNLMINSELSGEFKDASFDLPNGDRRASGGIYVFDSLQFDQAINALGGNLEEIFFPLSGLRGSDAVNPSELAAMSLASLLELTPLAVEIFDFGAINKPILEDLSLNVNIASGQAFTVVYDLAALSRVICTPSQCGAGSVNFFSSLSSGPVFFTDEFGNEITSISALGDPVVARVPEPSSLAIMSVGLFGVGFVARKQRKRRRSGM